MKDYKVGISITQLQQLYGDRRALELAAEAGADSVDFATSNYTKNGWDYRREHTLYGKGENAVVEYCSELREYARSLGIIIGQTHGRGAGFKNDPEHNDAEVKNARLDLMAAAALGAEVCVIHAPTSIYMGPDPDPKLMRDLCFEQYTRILPYAAEFGVKLATETFGDAVKFNSVDFFGDIREFLMIFNRIRTASPYGQWFTMCMDTGHSNKASRFGNPSPADVIRMLGDNITVLHLNDNDTLTDQHKPPMTGTIDWKDTMSALDEIGYRGIYNMELHLPHFGKGLEVETAAFAIKVMRHMLENK